MRNQTPKLTAALRRLVARGAGVVVPGAYDGVSARLVEHAGFEAVYMTGYGTAASRLGLPDLGFAGLAEMLENVRQIAGAVRILLIADADTGYGGPLAVERTVRAYEAAGVAALHLEDQVWPKRCGHLAGKELPSPRPDPAMPAYRDCQLRILLGEIRGVLCRNCPGGGLRGHPRGRRASPRDRETDCTTLRRLLAALGLAGKPPPGWAAVVGAAP